MHSSSRHWPSASEASRDREDLGVGRGVVGEFALVVAGGDHSAAVHHDRSDGDVVVGKGGSCFVERRGHRRVIGVVGIGEVLGASVHRHGGGSGIRTHGRLPFTRFPSVPIRPLSHPSLRFREDRNVGTRRLAGPSANPSWPGQRGQIGLVSARRFAAE